MLKILQYHSDREVTYVLSDDAEKLFEQITDKYRGQFNLNYTTSSQISVRFSAWIEHWREVPNFSEN